MVQAGDKVTGYSTDPEIRSRGSSGGLVTAVLAAALEKGLVENVVVLKRISEYEAVPIVTDDVNEVLASAGSMHTAPVNMAKYATCGKVAMPGKPCDIRAVLERAKRNDIDIDSTYLIGLNCGGTMHPLITRQMLVNMYGIDPEDVAGEKIEKGRLIFRTKAGDEIAMAIDELEENGYGRRENCRYCDVRIPVNADLACGNWGITGELAGNATFCEVMTGKGAQLLDNAIEAGFVEIATADEKSVAIREKINLSMLFLGEKWKESTFTGIPDQERIGYYMEMFADCIDCGACKEVCPVCTCGPDSKCTTYHDPADNYKMSMFHLVRLLHLSDSCIGCGQCSDVCPADIPLTTIFRRFADPAQKKHGYKAGMTPERPPFQEVMLR